MVRSVEAEHPYEEPLQVRPIVLERAEQWTARSRKGREYAIWISLPKGNAPEQGYPLIFVLDPHTAFATLVDWVRNHENMYGPVVVVGVGSPGDSHIDDRLLDLTPPTDPATLPAFRSDWGSVGGADDFLEFVTEIVRPQVSRRVPVDMTRQALFGHSLGGLFVLHSLFTKPTTFDTYVAASPSVWWGNKVVLREIAEFSKRQKDSGGPRRLLITIGELESKVNPEELRAAEMSSINLYEVRQHSRMVENAVALAAELAPLAAHGLHTVFARFVDETHNSVIPAYLSRGARFTLNHWFG